MSNKGRFYKKTITDVEIKNEVYDNASFSECVLANVIFINCKFIDTTFLRCHFNKTKFQNCVFKFSNFRSTTFFLADWSESILIETEFSRTSHDGGKWPDTTVIRSYFEDSGLELVSLERTIFSNCIFEETDLGKTIKNIETVGLTSKIPEKGSYTAFTIAYSEQYDSPVIVEGFVPEEARRFNPITTPVGYSSQWKTIGFYSLAGENLRDCLGTGEFKKGYSRITDSEVLSFGHFLTFDEALVSYQTERLPPISSGQHQKS